MMKKRFRMISLLLVMSFCCAMLSGCMGAISEVQINADGSGRMKYSAGMTKEALEMMSSMSGTEGSASAELDLSEYTPFEYNGVTYYGAIESKPFANVDELNALLNSEDIEESTNGVDTGSMKVTKNADGTFTLTLIASAETGDTTDMENQASAEEVDEEMVAAMMEDMAIVFEFDFPTNVTQTSGPNKGITINGKNLVIDLLGLDEITTGTVTYTFTTAVGGAGTPETPTTPETPVTAFTDVVVGSWYYDAVMAMAKGGLVQGIGNNLFAPEDVLTYAQFCQILARVKFLDVGTENGYWAYKAIESCIQAGYIQNRGEITSANYDVPITREAAVAAMYKGKQAELFLPTNSVTAADIPDYSAVSDVYKSDILNAYRFGITNGMDKNRTFNPMGQLTRAQVCQLFYNLDWTNPLVDTNS